MGGFTQLGLLIWKHVLRRLRQPGILALEYLWPVVLFLVLVALRQAWTPTKIPTCHRNPRAMPSAGGLIFLQNFLCNMGNPCVENDTSANVPGLPGLARLSSSITPLVSSAQRGHNIIQDVEDAVKILNPIEEQLQNPNIQGILDLNITVGNLFREPDYVEYYMADVLQIFNRSEGRALLGATIDVNKILDMLDEPNLRAVLCNATRLEQYLIFSPEVNVSLVSHSLCNMDYNNVEAFVNVIVAQIDVEKILEIASSITDATGSYTLSQGLRDVASLVDAASMSSFLQSAHDSLEAMRSVTAWLKQAADLLEGVDASTLNTLESLLSMMTTLTQTIPQLGVPGDVLNMMGIALDVAESLWTWSEGSPLELPAYLAPLSVSNLSAMLNNPLPAVLRPVGNVTVADLQLLISTPVDHSKMESLIIALSHGQDPMAVLCAAPGVEGIFLPTTPADARAIQQTLDRLCDMSYTDLLYTLGLDQDTMDAIIQNFQTSLAWMSIDWTQVLTNSTTLQTMLTTLGGNVDYLMTQLGSMNYSAVWDTVVDLAKVVETIRTTPLNESALVGQIASLHMRLDQHFPDAAASLDHVSSAMGSVMEYGLMAIRHKRAVLSYVIDLLINDPAMHAAVSVLFRQGLNDTNPLVILLTQEETIITLMTNASGFPSNLCNLTWLEDALDLDPASPADAQALIEVHSAFCVNLPHYSTELQRLMEIDALAKQGELIFRILMGETQGPVYSVPQLYGMLSNLTSYHFVDDVSPLRLDSAWDVTWEAASQHQLWKLYSELLHLDSGTFYYMLVTGAGETMQNTLLWPNMESTFTTTYRILLAANTVREGIADSKLARLSVLMLQYGPEIINAYMEEMVRLLETGSLPANLSGMRDVFCGASRSSLGLPGPVPLGEVQEIACDTSEDEWQRELSVLHTAVQQLQSATFTWFGLVWEAYKLFTFWIDDPRGLIYMMRSMTQAMGAVNMTAVTEVLMTAMGRPDLMVPVVTVVDEMLGNDTEWNHYKYMLNQSIEMMEANALFMEQMQDGGIPLSSFMTNGSQMQEMMIAAMETLPEIIDMVEDVIVQPVQMMQTMMTQDLTNKKLCVDIQLSDVMTFRDPTAINSLENMLCNFNMTEMLAEMMEMPVSEPFRDMITLLSTPRDSSNRVQMDWHRAMTTVSGMMNMTQDMSWLSNVNWLPIVDNQYLQAVQLSINSLVATVNQANMDSYTEVLMDMGEMAMTLTSTLTGVKDVLTWQTAFNEGAAHLINFINTHISKYNGSTVSLINYLSSTEFSRMLSTAVVESPDLITILIYSVEELMRDPVNAGAAHVAATNFCVDDAATAAIIRIPPNVTMTMAEVRGILCLFNFSAEIFVQELMSSIDGFSDLISQFEGLSMGSSMTMSSSAAYLEDTITQMVALVTDNPPTMILGSNVDVLDPQHWQLAWSAAIRLGNTFAYSPESVADFISSLLALLGELPLTLIDQLGLREFIAWEDAVLGELVKLIEKIQDRGVRVEDLLDGRPLTKKFYDQIRNTPALLAVMVHTQLQDGSVLQPLFSGDPMVLCSHDTAFSFPADPTLVQAFWEVHHVLCSANYTTLQIELNGLLDVQAILSMAHQPGPLPLNLTSINSNIWRFVSLLTQVDVYLNVDNMFTGLWSLIDVYMWESVFISLSQSSLNLESLSLQLEALVPMLDGLGVDTQMFLSLSQLMLNAGTTASTMIRDPVGLLANSTELQRANSAFTQLPMMLQSVLATLTGPKAEAFVSLVFSGVSLCQADLREVMTVPAGSDFDVVDFIAPLCAVDIQQLLNDHLPLVLDPSMMPSLPAGSMSQLIQQISQFQQDLLMPHAAAVDEEVLYDTFPWLNPSQYQTVLTFIDQTLMLPQTTDPLAINSYLQNLLNMIDITSMVVPPAYTNVIYSTLVVMNGKLDRIIEDDTVSGTVLFPDSPNLQQLLDMTGDLPHLMAIFMTSSSTPQFTQLISMNLTEISSVLCVMKTPLSLYLTQPPGSSVDLTDLQNQFCRLDLNALMRELEMEFNITTVQEAAIDQSQLMGVVNGFYSRISHIAANPPVIALHWDALNGTVWVNVLMQWAMANADPQMLADIYLQNLLNMVDVTTMVVPSAYTNVIYSTLVVMNGKLDRIIEDDTVSGAVLFPDSPNLQQLLNVTGDLPHLMAIFMTSSSTPQFTQLVSMNLTEISSVLCIMNTPLSLYLTQPPGSSVDLTDLQNQFCRLDLNALMRELEMEFNITTVQETVIDQSQLMGVVNGFYSRISHIAANSPAIALHWDALNGTVWEDVLMGLAMANADPQTLAHMVVPSLSALFNISVDATLQAYMDGLHEALLVINAKLQVLMNGGSVSLHDILPGSPTLLSFVEMTPDLPELMGILTASASTPQFQQLLTMDIEISRYMLCQYGLPISTYLSVPAGSTYNLTILQMQFCANNWTVIAGELSEEFNISQIAGYLLGQVQSAVPASVETIEQEITRLNEHILQIAANPPLLQMDWPWMEGSAWLQMLDKISQLIMPQNVSLEQQLDMYIQSVISMVSSFTHGTDYLNMVYSIITNLNIKLEEINTAGVVSTTSLFPNSPNIQLMLASAGNLPDIVAVLLASAPTTQFQGLFMMQPSTFTQACFSETPLLQAYLTVPQGSMFNLRSFEQQLCSLNLTALMTELTQEFTMNAVASQDVSSTTLLQAMVALYDGLGRLAANPPRLPMDWALLNSSVWVDALMLWGQQYSDPMMALNMSLSYVHSISDMIPDQATQNSLNAIHYAIQVLNAKIQALTPGGNITLHDIFPASPNLHNLLEMIGDIPQLLDLVLQNFDTPQFQQLFSVDINSFMHTICVQNVPLSTFMPAPSDSYNISLLQTKLCSINLESVVSELSMEFNITHIGAYINGQVQSAIPASVETIEQEITRLNEHILQIAANPPLLQMDWSLMEGSTWLQMLDDISQLIMPQNISLEQQLDMYIQSVISMVGSFTHGTDYLNLVYSIITNLNIKLEEINTAGVVSTTSLFPKSPNIQLMLASAGNLPDIVAVLLASAPTTQFQGLFMMQPSTFTQACLSGTPLLQAYLTVPQGSMFNLRLFEQQLCSLNLTALMTELTQEFTMNAVASQDVSSTMLLQAMMALYDGLGRLAVNPPRLPMNWALLNSTAWVDALMLWGQQYSDPMMALNMSLSNVHSISDMIPDQATQNSLNAIHYAIQVLNAKMHALTPGGNITLHDIFPASPNLHSLLEMIGDIPQLLDLVLQNFDTPQFQQLFSVDINSFMHMICVQHVPLSTFMPAPSDSYNISLLQTKLCSTNLESVVSELSMEFNISHIAAYINGQVPVATHVTTRDIDNEVSKFYSTIENLSENPPMLLMDWPLFNGSSWLQTLDHMARMLSANTVDQQTALMIPVIAIETIQTFTPGFNQYLNGLQAIVNVSNSWFERLYAGPVLNMTQLFPSSPNLHKLLVVAGDLPDIIGAAVLSSQTAKLQELIQMIVNGSAEQSLCQEKVPLSDYILRPPGSSLDLEKLQLQFCSMNYTAFLHELNQIQQNDYIMTMFQHTAPVDATALIASLTEFYLNLEGLSSSPPQLMMGWTWLNDSIWLHSLGNWWQQYTDPVFVMNSTFTELLPILELFGNEPTALLMKDMMTSLQMDLTILLRNASALTMEEYMSAIQQAVIPILTEVLLNSSMINDPEIIAIMDEIIQTTNWTDWVHMSQVTQKVLEHLYGNQTLAITDNYVAATKIVMEYILDLSSSSSRMAISQLLGNYSYVWETIQAAMEFDAELIADLLQVSVQLDQLNSLLSLSQAELATLACNVTHLSRYFVWPTTLDPSPIQTAFCNFDSTAFMEAMNTALDFNGLMTRVAEGLSAPRVSDDEFNAATMRFVEAIMNYTSLAGANIGQMSAADLEISLEQWWQQQNVGSSTDDIMNTLLSTLGSLLDFWTLLESQDQEYLNQVSRVWISVLASANRYLQGIKDSGMVSLSALMGNSTQLESVLAAVHRLDNATIHALLHSDMPAQLVSSMLDAENFTLDVCVGDALSQWSLPAELNVTLAELRQAFCAVNASALTESILAHLGWTNLLEALLPAYYQTSNQSSTSLSDETLTFIELLMSLPLMAQLQLEPNLVELSDLVSLMPAFVQAMANYSVEGGLEELYLSLAGNVTSMVPELDQIAQVVGGLLMVLRQEIDLIQDSSSTWMALLGNSTAMVDLYVTLMTSYQNITDDIYQQIMYNLTLSNLEQLVLVHGRAPFCDSDVITLALEAAYPLGLPQGMTVSSVQHILCDSSLEMWLEELQNISALNLTDMWPLMNQLSQSLVALANGSMPPSQWANYLQDHLKFLTEDMGDLVAVLPPELQHYVNYSYWESLVNNITMEIAANQMPNMTWLETLMEDMDQAFGNDSAWQEMLHVATAAAMYLQAINNDLSQAPLSLPDLLGDARTMEAWLLAALGNDTMGTSLSTLGSSAPMATMPGMTSPWQALINQTQLLVNNLLGISGSVDAMSSNMTSWLAQMDQDLMANQALAHWVNSASSNCGIGAMLWDEMLRMMNTSLRMSDILWYQQGALNLTEIVHQILPHISLTLCSLQNTSLSEVAQLMNSTLFTEFMEQLSSLMAGPGATSEECIDVMHRSNVMVRTIERVAPAMAEHISNSMLCVAQTSSMSIPIFQDVDRLAMLLREFHDLIRTVPPLSDLPMEDIEPYIQAIINGLQAQPDFEDIVSLVNSTGLRQILIASLHLPEEVANVLVNFITESNFTQLIQTNMSILEIGDLICLDNDDLMKSLNISDVMCTEFANITMRTLDMVLHSQNGSDTVDFLLLQQLLAHAIKVIDDFTLLSELGSLFQELDISNLIELLPHLEQLFFNRTLSETLRYDVQVLLDDLERAVPMELMTDMSAGIMTIVDGILGISLLGDQLPQSVIVHELLDDPEELRDYAVNQLNVSSDVIDALLDATFPITSLLSLYTSDPVSSIFCNSSIWSDVLDLATEAELALEAMCDQDYNTMANFSQALLDQLNIGQYIAAWLHMDATGMLNISTEQLRETAENFLPAAEALRMFDTNAENSLSLSDIMQLGQTGPGNVNQGMETIGNLLCGSSNTFQLADPAGVLETTNNDTWTPEQQQDMEAFPTEFCKDLYKEIQRIGDAGRVLWTLLKPMINGQILYSPDTPQTQAIMQEAQWMLDGLRTLENVTQEWTDALSNFTLNVTNGYDNLLAALDNPTISEALANQLGMDTSSLSGPLSLLASVSQSDIEDLRQVTQFIHDLTQCVTTKFVPVASEEQMQTKADQLKATNSFLAGVTFIDVSSNSRARRNAASPSPNMHEHVKYKLREFVDSEQSDAGLTFHRSTDVLFGFSWKPGPESNFFYNMQYFHGFLPLQDLIDHAIIKLQTGVDAVPSTAFQEMPYPCHTHDEYQFNVGSYYFPIVMALAWMVAVGNGIAALISDKETGVDHVFRLLGLRASMSWFAWFVNTFGSMIILSLIVLIILKVGQVMPASDTSVLFVYLLVFSFSSTMLSYMIGAFFTRATLGAMVGIILYLITFLPIIIIIAVQQTLFFWENIVLCLSSTSAFCYGCKFLMMYETAGVGLQWDNIGQAASESFTFSWILYMMLLDSAIYFLVGWYFRQIIPGKYMVPEKWYFPVSPSYWGCHCCKKNKYTHSNKTLDNGHQNGIYPGMDRKDSIDEMDLPVGVSLRHLTKRYKRNALAIDDLSVDLYEGAVTALLGHNGAGKTTTIRMLCGVYKPTSGVAYVGPYNTTTQVNKIHKVLGFCAQDDVLIEHMTVYEHLQFFAGMRGISGKENRNQIQRMLDSIKLRDSMHQKVSKLSGGQRRRLSVGLAFLGGSKVVILDEPTAGVDPAARRLVWEIIAQHRAGRTILLSTHHMDEAEMIGDRILLLHKGRLLSYGPPLALKMQHGSGYVLTVAKDNEAQEENIDMKLLTFLQGFISNASVLETRGQEVIFNLPTCDAMTMHDLLLDLEGRRKDLGVYRYGISATDMEQVFMKVVNEADENDLNDGTHENLAFEPDQNGKETNGALGATIDIETSAPVKHSGCYLKLMQFGALLYKRLLHNIRDIRCYVTQLLLPVLFILMALVASRLKTDRSQQDPLMLTPALYTGDMYMFHRDPFHLPLSAAMEQSLSNHDPWIATTCMPGSELEGRCTEQPGPYTVPSLSPEEEAVAQDPPDCDCSGIFIECPAGAAGAPPSRMRTATGDYLMNLTDHQLSTGEYLLRSQYEYKQVRYGGWSIAQDELGQMVGKTWFSNKGYHAAPAFYNGMSNMVLRGLLHEQGNMTWGQIKDYGITTYTHPLRSSLAQLTSYNRFDSLADVGVATAILLAFCFVVASVVIYLIQERASHEKQLQHIYGVGTFMYWMAAIFYDLLMYAGITAVATGITYAFNLPTFSRPVNILAYFAIIMMFGWSTIPFSYLLSRLFKDPTVGFISVFIVHMTIAFNMACAKMMLDLLQGQSEIIAETNRITSYVFMIFPQFCLGEGLVRITVNQYISDQYARFGIERFTPPFTFEGINWLLVAMAIEGFFFFVLTLIVDAPGFCCSRSKKKMVPADPNEDVDVSLERQRVVAGESRTQDLLTLYNIKKEYRKGFGKIPAVENLSVGVKHGECFGLLGVNGAGKSTTFKILTGELAPTMGAAYLLNKNITKNPSMLKQHAGYCPQFEALDLLLTVKQTIVFFAKLKGIPYSEHNKLCDVTAKKFGLTPFLNQKSKQLSGGTKRKLSAAVAMLGEPDIVLMDEPTTGMDPKARRLVWDNIRTAVNDNRSVILTSHSMAECDAVCTRLAIMVNGKLMCLGSGQHLKNRFGGGYILRLRLGHDANVTDTLDQLDIAFPGCVLVHRHLTTLVMELQLSEDQLSCPFQWLAEQRVRLAIRDFSLTQTTMDQVFLHFATGQTDGSEEMEQTNRRMSETINAWSRSSLGFIGDASEGFSNASTAAVSDHTHTPPMAGHSNPGFSADAENILNSKLTCTTPEAAQESSGDTHL